MRPEHEGRAMTGRGGRVKKVLQHVLREKMEGIQMDVHEFYAKLTKIAHRKPSAL